MENKSGKTSTVIPRLTDAKFATILPCDVFTREHFLMQKTHGSSSILGPSFRLYLYIIMTSWNKGIKMQTCVLSILLGQLIYHGLQHVPTNEFIFYSKNE